VGGSQWQLESSHRGGTGDGRMVGLKGVNCQRRRRRGGGGQRRVEEVMWGWGLHSTIKLSYILNKHF
jgi:hypothetical protein